MNCKRCEELLIDFMHDELGSSERELVKEHIAECVECSEQLREYQEVRRIFNEETLPEPSPQILATLSDSARNEETVENTTFWRKWFYFPVLAPAFASALALSVWFYHEGQNIYFSPDDSVSSGEVVADRMAEEPEFKSSLEREADPSDPDAIRELSKRIGSTRISEKGGESRQKEKTVAGAPPPAPQIAESEQVKFSTTDKTTEERQVGEGGRSFEYWDEDTATPNESMNQPSAKALPQTKEKKEAQLAARTDTEEVSESKERVIFGGAMLSSIQESNPRDQLNLALTLQKEGDCESSIETNEKLLDRSPQPPDSIKEKAYLSLAECYEKQGRWDKAISSYVSLKRIAPERAVFADTKIRDIFEKINFLQTGDTSSAPLESAE